MDSPWSQPALPSSPRSSGISEIHAVLADTVCVAADPQQSAAGGAGFAVEQGGRRGLAMQEEAKCPVAKLGWESRAGACSAVAFAAGPDGKG